MSELLILEAGVLQGVTKPTIDKICKVNITTVQALSMQSPKALATLAGIGESTAERAITKAVELVTMGFITADMLRDKRRERTHLKTGSRMLDALIGGGIESQTTTELSGGFATGKTQICHTIAVLAQLPVSEGGLGGCVAWIDTEDTFRPERIVQICETRDLQSDAMLKGIYHALAMNTQHQKLLVKQLYSLCPEKNVKLIIVDSILGHLRAEYIGRGTLAARQDQLKDILQHLLKVALSTKTTVVYTNQILSDPGQMYGNPDRPAGGNIMEHAAGTRLFLRKGRQDTRIAKLIDSLSLPEGEAPFVIDEYGIRDTEEFREEEDGTEED